MDPPPAVVSDFCDITNADRATAIRCIKSVKTGSSWHEKQEAALNLWFQHGGPPPEAQEDVGISELYGVGNAQSSLNVTAPTRPPSRVSQTEQLTASGLLSAHTGGGAGNAQQGFSQEDEDMKRAIAMSLQDSQQQTGVVAGNDENRPYFGPATRQDYDPSSWALTYSGSTAKEVIPDAPALDRQRLEYEPAFFKPLPSHEYLPNLITILASVSVSYNALLFPDSVLADYGFQEFWWQGLPIPKPSIIIDGVQTPVDNSDAVLREAQRLMAFYEHSNRSYGTVEPLSDIPSLKESSQPGMIACFLDAWTRAACQATGSEAPRTLFETCVVGHDGSGSSVEQTTYEFDIQDEEDPYGFPRTLYDALDRLVWGATYEEDAFIRKQADVLVMQVLNGTSDSGIGFEVPAAFYADRYLEANKQRAIAMKQRLQELHRDISKILDQQARLKTIRNADTDEKVTDVYKALDAAMTLVMRMTKKPEPPLIQIQEGDGDTVMASQDNEPEEPEMVKKLKSAKEGIKKKLQNLDDQKDRIFDEIQKEKYLLKDPNVKEGDPPTELYRLSGVATKPGVTYIQVRSSDEDPNAQSEWEWWRLDYQQQTSSAKILKTRIQEDEVLERARDENNKALLVYSSVKFDESERKPVPKELLTFVSKDIETFQQEVREARENGEWETGNAQSSNWKLKQEDPYSQPPPSYDENWGPRPEDEHMDDDRWGADPYYMEKNTQSDDAWHGDGIGSTLNTNDAQVERENAKGSEQQKDDLEGVTSSTREVDRSSMEVQGSDDDRDVDMEGGSNHLEFADMRKGG